MMIKCHICNTPTLAPDTYNFTVDTVYCFGCQRRLDLIKAETQQAKRHQAPVWTPEQQMSLNRAQNYPWKSTEQLLDHMRSEGYFIEVEREKHR